jgi:hypothetical protein
MSKNYTNEIVIPARRTANDLADALNRLILAQKELKKKKKSVPLYTGQWSDDQYYKDEQQEVNDAANAFEDAIVNSIKASINR